MNSYADYVEATYGSSQKWLVNFLRQGYPHCYWESRDPPTQIHVLDSVNGVMQEQTYKAMRSGPVETAFLSALRSRPVGSKTPLILAQCGQLGDTNSAYIDATASQLKLDPMFLCAHFQRCLYLTDGSRFLGVTQLPITIPSERDFISVRVGGENSDMTAAFIITDVDTSTEKIAHADRIPCKYIYPYVKESLKSLAGLVQGLGQDELIAGRREKPPRPFSWEWNEWNLQALISSRDSIKRYMKRNPAFLSDLTGAVEDCDALIEEAERTSTYMQARLQRHENDQVIKESKKNLQLADSVRRLAVIGVVFIPLSFATSFFGMNLEQLDTGTIHLGYFFLHAVLCGTLAFVLAACITPIEEAWMRALKRYKIRESGDDTDYE